MFERHAFPKHKKRSDEGDALDSQRNKRKKTCTLSHVDDAGNARMVNTSDKPDQLRVARAFGKIRLSKEAVKLLTENNIKKGNVLAVSEIAGIQGAKKTSELIPLCHNIRIDNIKVVAAIVKDGVEVTGEASSVGPTGVEMEALTAVAVALLAVYDMCKAVDRKMVIENIVLLEKTKMDLNAVSCRQKTTSTEKHHG